MSSFLPRGFLPFAREDRGSRGWRCFAAASSAFLTCSRRANNSRYAASSVPSCPERMAVLTFVRRRSEYLIITMKPLNIPTAGRSQRRRRLHRMTLYSLPVLRRDFFASCVQSGFPARPAVRAINCGPYFKYSGALARGLARFDRFRVAHRDGPLPVSSLVSDDRILDASVFH